MQVFEVFRSIQGEGLWSGAICTFIRFSGCTLRCANCDTMRSWAKDGGMEMSVPQIIEEVLRIDADPRHICITGGEPLEQPRVELFNLLQALQVRHGVKDLESIVIETNGAQDVGWFFNMPFRRITHLSVDYKLPAATGRMAKMLLTNYVHLGPRDVIKFVCKDESDLECAHKFLEALSVQVGCQAVMLFHASGGLAEDWLPQKLLSLEWADMRKRWDIRAGIQLHKMLKVA